MSTVLDKEMEFKTVYTVSTYHSMHICKPKPTKQQRYEINKEIFVEVDWSKARMSKSFPPSFTFKTF